MIKVTSNPITQKYSNSPTPHLAAVRVSDEIFAMVTERDPLNRKKFKVKSDGVANFRDGGFGRIFKFEIEGKKTPLTVYSRWHKVDENDFGPRTMFYVQHNDVPGGIPEVELQTGSNSTEEVEF